jgi:hypothetical protein
MVKAIRVHELGGPEASAGLSFSSPGGGGGGFSPLIIVSDAQAMRWEEVEVGEPKDGEIRVRNTAVGVNFIDVYFRKGVYPAPLPFTPGTVPI